MQQPQAAPTTRPPMRRRDWLIVAGIGLGAITGVGLTAFALAIALGLAAGPHLSGGATTGDVAAMIGAGATLLLASFTALLAWVTRRSIDATQREADIAAAALAASNRQADVAEKALKAAQDQVEVAKEQVAIAREQAAADKERADRERQQFEATTRPQLAEPRATQFVNLTADLVRPFGFEVVMVNLGPGIAFVAKGLLAMGSVIVMADAIKPKIVAAGDEVRFTFNLSGQSGLSDHAIANAMVNKQSLQVGALYSDITRQRAWRSRGSFVNRGTDQWLLVDVEVQDTSLDVLQ
jgi:hypothetical protein